jgi:hypothetical protein
VHRVRPETGLSLRRMKRKYLGARGTAAARY